MKAEDLLLSLDEIGEDLLAETETGLRVETRKPRPWAALAAALAAVVCLGGATAWFLRDRNNRKPDPAQTVVMPASDYDTELHPMEATEAPVVDPSESDKLSLQDCFFGIGIPLVEDRIYRDIDRELDLSPWSDKDPVNAQYLYGYPEEWQDPYPEIQLLVFGNAAQVDEDSGIGMDLSEEQMELRATHLAAVAGASVESVRWSEASTLRQDVDGSDITCFAWVRLETDLGELTCFGNGDYSWHFDTPLAVPEVGCEAYPFPTEPLSDENHGDYMRAWMGALADPEDEPPNLMSGCSVYYDEEGNAEKRFYLWNNQPYPHEDILGYSFSRVTMELDESGSLLALQSARQDEAGRLLGATQAGHDLVPDLDNARLFPWVPKDQADDLFRSGFYITTVSRDLFPEGDVSGQQLLEHAAHVEIVYRLDNATLFLPFYRYWIQLDSSDLAEGLTRYGAFYVPAIPIEALTDYPLTLMPGLQGSASADPDPGADSPLPVLSLAHCLGNNGEEAKLLRDPEGELALSPISDFTGALPAELPVYRNLAYVDESGIPVYLAPEDMQRMAEALLQRWGLTVQSERWVDGILRPEDPAGAEPRPSALILETDQATVTVYGNGEQTVFFREPLDKDNELAAEWVYDPEAPLTSERAAAYARAWAEYCAQTTGLTVQCEPIYGYADMDARTYTCIYYLTEPADSEETREQTQRLLEYTFHEQLYLDEQGNLTGYRTHLTSAVQVSDYAADLVGCYPIISKEEADQALLDGFCFTNASIPLFQNGQTRGEALLAHTVAAELVYRTGMEPYFLPYYRYWVVGDYPETAGGLTQCAAVYVPAVRREYLTNWPADLMPDQEEDPQLAELKALFEDENSWYGRILRAGPFVSPDQISLGALLNDGLPGGDHSLTDAERGELEAAAETEDLDMGTEPVKLPRQELNALLQGSLGLTLEEIQYHDLRNWVYLEDWDCYYLFGGDQSRIFIEIEGYTELSDGSLQLRYFRLEDGADKAIVWTANLRKTQEGWIVLSNQPAVWNN